MKNNQLLVIKSTDGVDICLIVIEDEFDIIEALDKTKSYAEWSGEIYIASKIPLPEDHEIPVMRPFAG